MTTNDNDQNNAIKIAQALQEQFVFTRHLVDTVPRWVMERVHFALAAKDLEIQQREKTAYRAGYDQGHKDGLRGLPPDDKCV